MDVTKKRQPFHGLNTFLKNSVNFLISCKKSWYPHDQGVVSDYKNSFGIISGLWRILFGKTSVMDVTLCRYGRDTSETQIEMVWEIINQTFTELWLTPTMILKSCFDVKKTIWNDYEDFMLKGFGSGHNNELALIGG